MAFYVFWSWRMAFQTPLDLKTRGALTTFTWKVVTRQECSAVRRCMGLTL